VRTLLADLAAELDTLEAALASPTAPPPTWETVVVPYEAITDRLDRVWGAVDHLKAVRDSADLRAAVDTVQPERVAFGLRLSQSRPLFDAFTALKGNAAAWAALTPAQHRAVANELRDFTLGGVGLDGADRARFNVIQQRLSALSTNFSNHLLDATKAWTRLVTDPAGVAGLPATARALTAQQAVAAGHAGATPEAGPWLITLDAPVFTPVMTHAADRALREDVYKAYVTRASAAGTEDDNLPLIDETLKLRKEKAALLGYPSFAALSMASKMATEDSAGALLEQLRAASRGPAEAEMKEVEAYARAHGFPADATFLNWDVTYYAERVREEK
jgi:oligopeptidase A